MWARWCPFEGRITEVGVWEPRGTPVLLEFTTQVGLERRRSLAVFHCQQRLVFSRTTIQVFSSKGFCFLPLLQAPSYHRHQRAAWNHLSPSAQTRSAAATKLRPRSRPLFPKRSWNPARSGWSSFNSELHVESRLEHMQSQVKLLQTLDGTVWRPQVNRAQTGGAVAPSDHWWPPWH